MEKFQIQNFKSKHSSKSVKKKSKSKKIKTSKKAPQKTGNQ
jgi:hypothetical protein